MTGNLLLVGEKMHERGTWRHPTCPRECGCEKETRLHPFQCSKGDSIWNKLTVTMHKWGSFNHAAPGVISAILTGISAWRTQQSAQRMEMKPAINEAFQHQARIGWAQALMGLLSPKWANIQNEHLLSIRSKRSGRQWMASLIRKLWDVSWDLWNHRNHILHSADGPAKALLIERINQRIMYHRERGMRGLPLRCHFLFRDNIDRLLQRPIRSRVAWLAAVSSARKLNVCKARNQHLQDDPDDQLLQQVTRRDAEAKGKLGMPSQTLPVKEIDDRIRANYSKGMQGLPERRRTLFNESLDTLLAKPTRARLEWLSSVTKARRAHEQMTDRRRDFLDPDHALLGQLLDGRQLSQLTRVDKLPTLHTKAGPDKSKTLYIEREDDEPDHLSPDHDFARDSLRILCPR